MLMSVPELTIRTSHRRFRLTSDEARGLLEHIHESAGEHRTDAEAPLLQAINSQGAIEVRPCVNYGG